MNHLDARLAQQLRKAPSLSQGAGRVESRKRHVHHANAGGLVSGAQGAVLVKMKHRELESFVVERLQRSHRVQLRAAHRKSIDAVADADAVAARHGRITHAMSGQPRTQTTRVTAGPTCRIRTARSQSRRPYIEAC